MSKNTVIVLGAGFSVPAGIPTQQKLLEEIMGTSNKSFLEEEPVFSKKYLHSFVRIGLFLLESYSMANVDLLKQQYIALLDFEKNSKAKIAYIQDLISFLEEKYQVNLDNDNDVKKLSQDGVYVYDEIIKKLSMDKLENEAFDANYIKKLMELKHNISKEMQERKIDVDLEDVFTNFDKSIKQKENFGRYNHIQIEQLRNDLIKIFIYHFAKASNNFNSNYYKNFLKIVRGKENVSIISLNWDLVIERLFKENKINYDSSLAKSFWCSDSNSSKKNNKNICLYKLHGSINWLKCHHCGKINIIKKSDLEDTSLFNDCKEDKCLSCKMVDKDGDTLLQAEIITPTMIKALENQLYQNIWSGASRAISSADEIIFIGYSLPLADFDFRYVLKNNVSSNCKIKVVLAPKDKPKKSNLDLAPEIRYKKLFFNILDNLSFDYKGVEEATLEI